MSESKPRIISQNVGRRKESVASVRIVPGSGEIVVNGKSAAAYFPGEAYKMRFTKPFSVLSLSKYDASVKVRGGGINGQLDAVVLGIARALSEIKEDFKTTLRGANLLTRDSRTRQRRMVGTGGKSRRKKQSPKR